MTGTFTRFAPADFGVTTTPLPDEAVWLDIRSDVGRRIRVVSFGLLTVAAAICVAGGLPLILRIAPQDRLLAVAVLARYILPVLYVLWAILYYRALSWLPLALGTDGRLLMLRDKTSRVIASETIGAVYTDGAYLLIGRRLVPLHHLHRDAFDVGRLRAEIIGRLPATAFVRRNALGWRALRAGNHGLILSLLFICLVCLDRATR